MKKVFYWLLAIVITLAAVIYQRKTGPTYDKKMLVKVNNTDYEVKLVRSIEIGSNTEVKLAIDDQDIGAKLFYKRFQTNDQYQSIDFSYKVKPVDSYIMNNVFHITEEKGWFASVPEQPAAGKIQYYFEITNSEGTNTYMKTNPVVIRFKGAVPSSILAPHIFFMFFAMLLGNLAGIMAVFKHQRYKFYTTVTLFTLLVGGMILGPAVQLHAFGEAWAGVPFAWDLTDNKTLVAFIFWILAFVMNRKKERPIFTIIASIVMLIVYSIPHSMYGSQLDPETGEIIQAWIQSFIF
ncbi:hypothetical protein SLH46_18875 [Draconibacterium sp. IB214405]|uniref:hypothetical protein n=1 Tax=Draconibacterium sp. IB214405 TaxID=3097352 RepID=UPI002A148605|nr:hypothetical protein [Draconibacterium sp. IB214405]MDX8341271.1 hypothetical protein [Draconibacterium sp. IB214405]